MKLGNTTESQRVGSPIKKLPVIGEPTAGYFWAGNTLSFEEACKHFVTVGATGAGKSITLNLLMQSVFHRFGLDDGVKRRALVYDAKADLVGFLSGVLPIERITILNPFDRRFSPWNIGADIRTATDAIEFASILLPKNERDSSPYFADTARSLMAGVITRFNATTLRDEFWTFRDLILAFETTARLKAVLNHPRTAYLQDHFRPANLKNFAGVKSTADTALALYRPIAAFFASAKKKPFSLKDWVKDDGTVLVLGNHESAREATDTLNRLMFRQLSKFLIGRSGRIERDQTWVFLDELREMGALSGLRQLLLRGRSKGVAIAMGFQDVEGIYAAYGEREGAEIIGAAQTAALLHINATSPRTAEWASQVFSSRRDVVSSSSESIGQQFSMGSARKVELVPNVFPIEFISLPMPSISKGLHYFACTNANDIGYGRGVYPWEWLKQHGPLGVEEGADDFENHPDYEKPLDVLLPWKRADVERLGLKKIKIEEGEPPASPPPP